MIYFDYNGKLDEQKTKDALINQFIKTKTIVIPGFYGSYPNGNIHLFSRGGSDVTGAVVAKALSADLYENWTDVSGFLVADPKIVSHPKKDKKRFLMKNYANYHTWVRMCFMKKLFFLCKN